MQKYLLIIGLIVISVFFLSNAGGVPQGVTGSPTESSHNSCGTCHDPQGNFNIDASLKILNKDNQTVINYTPGETYTVNLQLNATNSPKSYGFQLTVIDENSKLDQGTWIKFGEKVKQVNMTILQKQRRYLSHSSPKTDGFFTAEWKAPDLDNGHIVFYYAGLAVNLNGNNSGDNHITGNFKLQSKISSVDDNHLTKKSMISPNPAGNLINIHSEQISFIEVIDASGRTKENFNVESSTLDISCLLSGYYICRMKDNNGQVLSTQKLIKL